MKPNSVAFASSGSGEPFEGAWIGVLSAGGGFIGSLRSPDFIRQAGWLWRADLPPNIVITDRPGGLVITLANYYRWFLSSIPTVVRF